MRNGMWIVVGGIGALILLALLNLFAVPPASRHARPLIDYSRFIADVDQGKVDSVAIQGASISGRLKDGQVFNSYAPHTGVVPALTERLLIKGVAVAGRPPVEEETSALTALVAWLPMIAFFAVLYFAFARPLLALSRQIEAFVNVMQGQPPRSPSPS